MIFQHPAKRGNQVVVVAPTRMGRMSWGDSGRAKALSEGVAQLEVWEPGPLDTLRSNILHPLVRMYAPRLEPRLNLLAHRGVARHLLEIASRHQADVAVLNYAFAAKLLDSIPGTPSVCDVHDLLVANFRMQASVRRRIHRLDGAYRGRGPLPGGVDRAAWIDPRERALLARFDGLIHISEKDLESLGPLPIDQVSRLIPSFYPSLPAPSPKYGGPAGLLLGDNPLNLEGLSWFLGCCLPEIRRACPDFQLRIGGTICGRLRGRLDGVEVVGRLDEVAAFYDTCGYVLCPTFLGTGEQIKIGEAMVYAKATVSFDGMSSPVRDRVDGFRVRDGAGFVDAVIRLDRQEELRAAMGRNARLRIEVDRDEGILLDALEEMLRSTIAIASRREGLR